MAGEIKLNNVSIATENAGTVTINNATLGNSMVLGTNASPIANNLVFANGNGIDFSAAAGSAAGSNSALLDDYEEGTWTPTLRGGTNEGNFNYTTQYGWYVKVGNLVVVDLNIYATTDSNNLPTGTLEIVSLPFNPDGEAVGSFQCNDMGSSYQANVGQYSSIVQSNVYHIHFRGTTTNGGVYQTMQAQSVAYLRVTISYKSD